MKPYVKLSEAVMPDGTVYSLHKHDGKFYLKYNGYELMSTALTFSEQLLADLGCARLLEGKPSRPAHPRILIGGLGLGFTLKRTLELVGSPATVDVAELMPPLIEWNRTFLVEHNGPLLEDPRTSIVQGDLFDIISSTPKASYDALLLDIDNTPDDLITSGNARLYSPGFLDKLRQTITPTGRIAYWLSEPAPKFRKLLIKAGFQIEEHAAKPHEKSKRARHCIYVATRKN
ncbi:MAG: spermine synthase [Verrucomicrobiales bacterium]|nr:spermine synthase [Verrucomicrobiota bacterium JB025]